MKIQKYRTQLFIKLATVACFFLLMSSGAFAREYNIDPTHSRIGFVVRHLVSKVPGNFNEFEGSFNFDPKNPEKSKVRALVKSASVNTENKKRDDHLRSDDFFASEKHPTLTFESVKVSSGKKGHYNMDGNLTLLGVTKPVRFDVEFLGEAKDPFGAGQRAGFVAIGKINRQEFGMK